MAHSARRILILTAACLTLASHAVVLSESPQRTAKVTAYRWCPKGEHAYTLTRVTGFEIDGARGLVNEVEEYLWGTGPRVTPSEYGGY